MSSKADINQLRTYFKSLKTSQKKEFIHNLRKKIESVKDSKYRDFLLECTKEYNSEIAALKKAANSKASVVTANETKVINTKPQLSDESFAIAFAAMISPNKASHKTIAMRLLGRWQREQQGTVKYFDFRKDGTFETNETTRSEIVNGRFTTGFDGMLLLEPVEKIGVTGVIISVNSLALSFASGVTYEYKRI